MVKGIATTEFAGATTSAEPCAVLTTETSACCSLCPFTLGISSESSADGSNRAINEICVAPESSPAHAIAEHAITAHATIEHAIAEHAAMQPANRLDHRFTLQISAGRSQFVNRCWIFKSQITNHNYNYKLLHVLPQVFARVLGVQLGELAQQFLRLLVLRHRH